MTLVSDLRSYGYDDLPLPDSRRWNFVMGDGDGHEIDLHVITRDSSGNGIYGPRENNEWYPAESLKWKGSIQQRELACISPEQLAQFDSGHDLKPKDRADVAALCAGFEIPRLDEYKEFKGNVDDA